MPLTRRIAIAAVMGIGVWTSASHAASAEWTRTAPMPQPRWFHAAGAGSDGRVYAYGGYVWTPTDHRAYGIGELGLVVFDPANGTWSIGPPPPESRQRVRVHIRGRGPADPNAPGAAIQFSDSETSGPLPHELYSGEQSPGGRPHWFSRNGAVVFFNAALGAWEQKPSAAIVADVWDPDDARFGRLGLWVRKYQGSPPVYWRVVATTATSADGKVYVIGGTGRLLGDEHALDESSLLATVDVYDAVANRWHAIPPMREARQLHAAAVGRDGRLYVFGGVASPGGIGRKPDESDESWERRMAANRKAADSSLASVEIYDPKSDSWSKGAPMPTPRQAMGAALGADGKIYLVGGTKSYSTPDPLDTVEIYDPATDTWEKGPPLIYPRRGHAVVATPDGKIYAIGGSVWSRKLRLPMSDAPRFEEDGKDLRATVEVLETKPVP